MSIKVKSKDKRKYYALLLGVMMVALLAGGSMLQSTYVLEGDWSLEMSISNIVINSAEVWPGNSISVVGSAEEGFDSVILSADDMLPINPLGADTVRADTGIPAIGVSLGSFTQPIPVIDTESSPGSKIYTWTFTGYISVQTFAAIAIVDAYNFGSDTVTEVAELSKLTIDVEVDFNIVGGEDAVGSCVFSDSVSVLGSQQMVDYYGAAASYETEFSTKVPMINTLSATENMLPNKVDVLVTGDIAASAEIYEGDMIVYNSYSEFPITFEVVQTVGELDNARFGVPAAVNWLPTSADAIIEDPTLIIIIIIITVIILVIFASVSYLYGKPKNPAPRSRSP